MSHPIMNKRGWIGAFHIFFWLILSLLAGMFFYGFLHSLGQTLLVLSVFVGGFLVLTYGHILFLYPRYFQKGAYVQYFFGLVLLIVGTTMFRVSVARAIVEQFEWTLAPLFTQNYLGGAFVGSLFVLLLTLPLRLIENWIKKQELEHQLKTQQLEAELRFLKAQVNPHFLFNALNNIYALSFIQSEKAPEMILKLSDMMSYMLYDCKEELVPLHSEIHYLENYIALQQLKKDGEQNISFETNASLTGLSIPPLLFIPFFENAFKHGNLEDLENGWVRATLTIRDQHIYFDIKNSRSTYRNKPMKGGVGLENIHNRLQLLFPGKHTLMIESLADTYCVSLNLDLSPISIPTNP